MSREATATAQAVWGMTLSGPWGQDDASSIVAVVIEDDGAGGRRWRPLPRELADAINARHIASFNLFMSLGPAERALMAPLYRLPAVRAVR